MRGSRKFCKGGGGGGGGGSNSNDVVFSLVDKGREDQNTIKSGPPSVRTQNTIEMVFRLWPNIECWLVSFVVLQGIRTGIAKKLPVPPSGSAHGHYGI